MSDALYCFGIALGQDLPAADPEPIAAPGTGLALVPIGTVSVIVCPTLLDSVPSKRRFLRAHTRVLESAGEATVLPMRFGTIAMSSAALEEAVLPRVPELLGLLQKFRDCGEFGLRASTSEEVLLRRAVARHPALRAQAGGGRTRSHAAKIALGRQVAEALDRERDAAGKVLMGRIAPLVEDRILRAPESAHEVLRADILLRRDRENELIAMLEESAEEPALDVKLVGPAPLYSFVSLQIPLPVRAREAR
ncbi:MAG: GvpL/GvpF family gas vesicle protein [Pseudomonadota bacterium]